MEKARILRKEIWNLAKSFPPEEKYRLMDQIIRSSRSITATIAEGHGRYTFKDQIHFCIIARGSLSESHDHLINAFDCNYISKEKLTYFHKKIAEIGRLLNGYITYLRSCSNQLTS